MRTTGDVLVEVYNKDVKKKSKEKRFAMSVDGFRKREIRYIEYMCRYCGTKTSKGKDRGRPMPGKCPKRSGNMPHSWVKNREW